MHEPHYTWTDIRRHRGQWHDQRQHDYEGYQVDAAEATAAAMPGLFCPDEVGERVCDRNGYCDH